MIRQARVNEADAVRDVVLAAYGRYVPVIGTPPGPMLDDYAARIAAGQVWVLEPHQPDGNSPNALQDGAAIAGVLVLEDGPDRFLLDNIAVRPDWQGLGIGRVLLDFAEAEAARCGWDRITLYTNALMVENIAIYAARGYIDLARRVEQGFDRVYMQKRLPQRT